MVIDNSGVKVFGAGEWPHEKHGGTPHWSWRKLHLAVDPNSDESLAWELTTTDEGDASLVGPLLDQVDSPLASVPADGAYDGELVYRSIAGHTPNATVTIPPRSTAVMCRVGHRPHSARPPHPADRGVWSPGMAARRRLRPPVSREGAVLLYKVLIGLHARTLLTQKTGQGRLQGHQHHDRPRHAGIPSDCLTRMGKGEIRPVSDFRTNVLFGEVEPCRHSPHRPIHGHHASHVDDRRNLPLAGGSDGMILIRGIVSSHAFRGQLLSGMVFSST